MKMVVPIKYMDILDKQINSKWQYIRFGKCEETTEDSWQTKAEFRKWYLDNIVEYKKMPYEYLSKGFSIVPRFGYEVYEGYIPNEICLIPKHLGMTMVDCMDGFGVRLNKFSAVRPYSIILYDLETHKTVYIDSSSDEIAAETIGLSYRMLQMKKLYDESESWLPERAKNAYLNNILEIEERIASNREYLEDLKFV